MPEYEPTITVLENSAAVEARAAEIVINQVLWKPDSTLTLPTGGTPVGMYRLLVEAYQNGVVDFSKVNEEFVDSDDKVDFKTRLQQESFLLRFLFWLNSQVKFIFFTGLPATLRSISNDLF